MSYNLNFSLCCKITSNMHKLNLHNTYSCTQSFSNVLHFDKGGRISSSIFKTKIWIFVPLEFEKARFVAWYAQTQSLTPIKERLQARDQKTPLTCPIVVQWVKKSKNSGSVRSRGRSWPLVSYQTGEKVSYYFGQLPAKSQKRGFADSELRIPSYNISGHSWFTAL